MTVVPGNTFVRILPGRRRKRYVVRAVRWAPVRYAEIEPVDGGRRATVPLHRVEQCVAQEQSADQRALGCRLDPCERVYAGTTKVSAGLSLDARHAMHVGNHGVKTTARLHAISDNRTLEHAVSVISTITSRLAAISTTTPFVASRKSSTRLSLAPLMFLCVPKASRCICRPEGRGPIGTVRCVRLVRLRPGATVRPTCAPC